jgi:hypothetical protein
VLERARAAIEFYAAADVHDRPGRLEVALSPPRSLSGLTATEQRISADRSAMLRRRARLRAVTDACAPRANAAAW